jgi:acyl dehydratase
MLYALSQSRDIYPGALNMPEVETDQAAREASGAHPYGRYLEEFEVGAVYKHWPAKTVTEADDHLFCLITMNHHPLHLNDVYAQESQQGRNVVVGPLVYSLALGMSVSDVSGKAIANLATEELSHPAPVFHGDTLFCESEVLEVKESKSKPDRGTVRVHTRVLNQDGVLVAEFKRLDLFRVCEHLVLRPGSLPRPPPFFLYTRSRSVLWPTLHQSVRQRHSTPVCKRG